MLGSHPRNVMQRTVDLWLPLKIWACFGAGFPIHPTVTGRQLAWATPTCARGMCTQLTRDSFRPVGLPLPPASVFSIREKEKQNTGYRFLLYGEQCEKHPKKLEGRFKWCLQINASGVPQCFKWRQYISVFWNSFELSEQLLGTRKAPYQQLHTSIQLGEHAYRNKLWKSQDCVLSSMERNKLSAKPEEQETLLQQ